MTDAPAVMTADELYRYDVPGKRSELVRGRLVLREPASFYHGVVAGRVLMRIGAWLESDRLARGAPEPLGDLLAADTGFALTRDPDTVRAPDLAFVYAERRPTTSRGFPELAPDVAVEVRSPNDRVGEVLAKVGDWLSAGTALVWVIDPDRRAAQEFRPDGSIRLIAASDDLTGDPVLPGLRLPLSDLLANLPAG